MAQNTSDIPNNESEPSCVISSSKNESSLEDLDSHKVLLNDISDLNKNSLLTDAELPHNNCLPDAHPPNEESLFDQQLPDCSTSQNADISNEISDIQEDLECEKNFPVCDSESCTSSDSMLEMNADNLSIGSASSQDSRQQDCSPIVKKVAHGLPTNDFIKSLEARNSILEKQILELTRSLYAQEIAFKKSESQTRTEFLNNIEKLSKDCNALRKDKETMVVRYANSEKDVIMEKKARQDLEKKMKDMSKERDNLLSKLKNLTTENNRLNSLNDSKLIEIAKLQKSVDKLNSDFNAREIRIKWLQNNLKTEMNSHQETQAKLDHTVHRLNEMKEEAEQVRRDCQEMIKCYQEDEEIKSVKLDSQLKLKLTELEVQKQEKCDQEQVYQLLRHELEALKKKQRMTMEENSSLTLKIHNLEKQRLEYEQNLSKLKDSQNTLKQEIVDLTARSAEMETLQLQLEREKEKSAASLREIERLRSTNAELQADMNACHTKEGELLKFTEGVTDTNVKLQSAYSLLEVKAQALEEELTETKLQLTDFQDKYTLSVSEIEKLRKEHEDEGQLLAKKLAEKVKIIEKLNMKLDESENENRVLKRRHIASIKELSRELCECKRRLDGFESTNGIRGESSSLGSRASSAASLDVNNYNSNESKGFTNFSSSPSKCSNGKSPGKEKKDSDMPGIDKEMLIEKIIKLQKQMASKNERIDFLKDHIVHLVKAMKKRCKCEELKTV